MLLVSQTLFFVAVSPGLIAASDHLLYIPSAGLCALLVWGGAAGFRKIGALAPKLAPRLPYLAAVIFVFFFAVTVQNSVYARSEIGMLKQSLRYNPENRRVRQAYGVALNRAGHPREAEEAFRTLLAGDHTDVRAHVGLGRVYCDQKRLLECIDQFQQAVHYSGGEASLAADLKLLYGYLIERNEKLIAEGRGTPELYRQLGIAYGNLGNPQKSGEYLQKARPMNAAPQ
jgi:tetratricopeptide (TPR) repeat protein